MIKGYINAIVSKNYLHYALEKHFHEDDTLNFYDVLHDKLEDLTLAGNLPIFTGFYTEYLDDAENEIDHKLDDNLVIRNYVYRNEMKEA